jgi:ADP-ribosylglycohydrolase
MRISWLEITDKIKYELQQLKEEGNDVDELIDEWNNLEKEGINAPGFRDKAELFYKNLEVSFNTKNEKIEFIEYDKKENIPSFTESFLENRILGGWLGRSAGCLLGKPVEKTSRSGIIELLSSNDTWPITGYISGEGIPETLLQKYPWNRHNGKESLKENIECMPEDDDMNYPMINLLAYEQYGENITTENILQTWLEMLPVLSTFTAERVAYINALNGIRPPDTAIIRNPYREWIGAQIRADLWGWISPGQCGRAVDLAYRDACLSHIRNGIYGEIFFAAAIAASFNYDDIYEVVNAALPFIPQGSRFSDAVNYVLSIPVQEQPWDETVDLIYKKFGMYHWVHTINNTALVVAALLSSGNNFEQAICNVVMGGWDTDSNGATVGSIMGTMLGAKKLPSKWISPLKNTIRSSIKGFDNSLLSDLAKRTLKVSSFHST